MVDNYLILMVDLITPISVLLLTKSVSFPGPAVCRGGGDPPQLGTAGSPVEVHGYAV